ncbi:DNA polymerase III subunit delta' [Kushneria phosphatilytica]|uniref:DNA polymerase III subunit delta' n=1 Tax=Kushneria phosphatilytica TaxID=657387 RepID=A0A1S1NW74_9GAMM|nr:DNA polymerase III subunit delta' [Kushneria phosphatilytica]OHV11810.1 DNA polymerase III subunit delta' [Kushneria phosphatilytica]QEL10975.1 DNA polymerase III subunit delta' [Kushneria phosphatilytica]
MAVAEADSPVSGPAPWPWQQTLWQHYLRLARAGRMPHALMLSGPAGIGKERFAEALLARQLCHAPADLACGHCHACRMRQAGHHPDLLGIAPAESGKQIRIDSIRDINHFVSQTAQQGGYRVIRIAPAESMTVSASNALLKSLEEPGERTLFLLLCDIPSRALPTIRSRCQQWPFPLPDKSQCLPWLREELGEQEDADFWLRVAGNQPLLARSLAGGESRELRQLLRDIFEALVRGADPVSEAARLERQPLVTILWYGIEWLEDLVRFGLSGNADHVRNEDLMPLYRQAVKNGRVRDWFKLLDYVREQRRLLISGGNPNDRLVLEAWLIRWSALLRS